MTSLASNSARSARAALGGISLLLAVALVFQASADARALARELESGAQSRLVAQTQPRVTVRVARRQTEVPARLSAFQPRPVAWLAAACPTCEAAPAPRRLCVRLLDLPPPLA